MKKKRDILTFFKDRHRFSVHHLCPKGPAALSATNVKMSLSLKPSIIKREILTLF